MKTSAKTLISLLKSNDDMTLTQYEGKDFCTIKFEENEELLSFILKNVFFYKDSKFSIKVLKENKKKAEWIQILLNVTFSKCEEEKDDINLYSFCNRCFSQFIYPITLIYRNFLTTIGQMKEKYQYDLFGCLIAFLSFLNGNMHYLKIIADIGNSRLLTRLKISYDKQRNKMLWIILTKYCNLKNIPVIYEIKEDINIDELKNALIEINCFVDMCQVNQLFNKLAKTIFQCLSSCDFNDLRQNRPNPVKQYIENIFSILNVYMVNCKYSDEYYLSYIFSEIFTTAYNFTSKYFNENYIDFVIQYVSKYNLPSEDFFNLFMIGLNKDNFGATFKNIQLPENIKDIDDKETIKLLVNKMIQRKKKKKKNKKEKNSEKNKETTNEPEEKNITLSVNLTKNDESKGNPDESNISINRKENEETKKENDSNEHNEEKEDNKAKKEMEKLDLNNNCELLDHKKESNSQIENSQISNDVLIKEISILKQTNNDLRNKFSDLEKANANILRKNSNMETQISNLVKERYIIEDKINNMNDTILSLKEEINDLNEEKGDMQNHISSLDIKIKKSNAEACKLNKLIEIISFRDLTKRMLDNMIEYVENRDKKILNGISKRKEKLQIIIDKFNFNDIQYMQGAINDLREKYYNSNNLSHVPSHVQSIKKMPYGLVVDPEGSIAKKYYKIMIQSKDDRILNFMINHLNIKKEIKSIYLDKK